MSLCSDSYHRWDAQKALAKGGVEDGDACDCGAVRFGVSRHPIARMLRACADRIDAGEKWQDALGDYGLVLLVVNRADTP